jgi:hypothetical protein
LYCLEGEGVAPDEGVKAGPTDFAGSDPVLEAAAAVLSRKVMFPVSGAGWPLSAPLIGSAYPASDENRGSKQHDTVT